MTPARQLQREPSYASLRLPGGGRSTTASAMGEDGKDLEIQILMADRECLGDQVGRGDGFKGFRFTWGAGLGDRGERVRGLWQG